MATSARIQPVKGLYNLHPQMISLIMQFLNNGYSFYHSTYFAAKELRDLFDEPRKG